MEVKIKTQFIDEIVSLCAEKYVDESIAIKAYSKFCEPMFTATVCADKPPSPGCVWLKGWSENEGIPEALVKAGVVELTGKTIQCGYVDAVEARLLVDIN